MWIVGQATPGIWSWVDRTGQDRPLDHTILPSDMSFTFSKAGNVRIPPELQGGRIYISKGAPLTVTVSPDNNG